MADSAAAAKEPQIIAPASVTRFSGQAMELRTNVWEITMGDAVPAFVLANGPARITNYNFLQLR